MSTYRTTMHFPIDKRFAHTFFDQFKEIQYVWIKNPKGKFGGDAEADGKKLHRALETKAKRDFILIPRPGPRVPSKSSAEIKLVTTMTEEGMQASNYRITFELETTCECLVWGTIDGARHAYLAPMTASTPYLPIKDRYSEVEMNVLCEIIGCSPDECIRYYNNLDWHLRNNKEDPPAFKKPSKTIAPHGAREIILLNSFGFKP